MKKKCCHNFGEDSTFIISSKRIMVYPEIIDCYCPICKKRFEYRKDGEEFTPLVKEEK